MSEVSDLKPDELKRLLETMAKVTSIDLDLLEAARNARLSPREKVLRDLESQGTKGRMTKIKKRGPGRPKVHWKARKRKHRESRRKWEREHYREVGRPRRLAKMGDALGSGDWFSYCQVSWKSNAQKVEMTKAQWDEKIAPHVGDRRPVVFRYDKEGTISLYNVLVKDSDTREVLYDGQEQKMKDEGFAL